MRFLHIISKSEELYLNCNKVSQVVDVKVVRKSKETSEDSGENHAKAQIIPQVHAFCHVATVEES